MTGALEEKTKFLRVVQEYLEDNIAITSEMSEAKTMVEMEARLKELVELNEGLLTYLGKEIEVLAKQTGVGDRTPTSLN
jgi:hypothetical protein